MSTITADTFLAQLVAVGNTAADAQAAIDSLIEAGIEDTEGDTLTDAEQQVVRDQLDAD